MSGFRKTSEPKARQLYRDALFRARAQRSLDGVLRAARAFMALGDLEVARQCASIAAAIAAANGDAESLAKARAIAVLISEEALLAAQFPP